MIFFVRYLIFRGMTIFPFVFVRHDAPLKTLEHEMIHYEQQKECLFVFAYLIYWAEFLFKFMYYWSVKKAYYAISFEREAFLFEDLQKYFCTRNRYFWLSLVWMSNVIKVSSTSPDATIDELLNKPMGSICQYTGTYTDLLIRVENYRVANYPNKDFRLTEVLSGNNIYSVYGPNHFIVRLSINTAAPIPNSFPTS